MKYHSLLTLSFACLSLLALSATRTHADIAMKAQEQGGDVVFSFSGSIDLTGLGEGQTSSSRGGVYPVNAYIEFGPAASIPDSTTLYLSSVVTAGSTVNFGSGGFALPTSSDGSFFSVNNNSIKLPLGYASGSAISGTVTVGGTSLAEMQVAPSDAPYVWVLTNGQEISLTILDAGDDKIDKRTELKKEIRKLKKKLRSAKAKDQTKRVKKFKKRIGRLRFKMKRL